MCIAVPAKIEEIIDNDAIVSYGNVKVKVNIVFIDDPKVGDFILVHAGCAIQKIDEEYAKETLEIFKELSEAIEECNISGHSKGV